MPDRKVGIKLQLAINAEGTARQKIPGPQNAKIKLDKHAENERTRREAPAVYRPDRQVGIG